MTPEDIENAIDAALGNKIVLTYPVLFVLVIVLGLAAYLGAYIKQKGQNRALEENVQTLTVKVEEIKSVYSRQIEDYKFQIRVREQAAKVAEYMELARHLREDSPTSDYQMANRLAWKLAMWLPSEIYKRMAESLACPNEQNNPLEVVIAVRRLLLVEQAGDLTSENILSHAPGIGKARL